MNQISDYVTYLRPKTLRTFENAFKISEDIIFRTNQTIEKYFKLNNLELEKVCFVAVGSVGRLEALGSSDLDLVPVVMDDFKSKYRFHDKKLRSEIENVLGLHVSTGNDLTKFTGIKELIDKKKIGGDKDNNSYLTKRILILTEGTQAGGKLQIRVVKEKIIEAYSQSASTRGRHVLTLCNDIARYYRTLCIEYKAKIDVTNKDWCTRNVKLRHSRKVWYFSSLLAMVSRAESNHLDTDNFKKDLLNLFDLPPIVRIFKSVEIYQHPNVGKLLEYYAWFLEFMSFQQNREELKKIKHETRYEGSTNVYYPVKLNSDLLHIYICNIIHELTPNKRQRIIDWFLM
jgi:hypothetical protein